jgi:hypothetical protein
LAFRLELVFELRATIDLDGSEWLHFENKKSGKSSFRLVHLTERRPEQYKRFAVLRDPWEPGPSASIDTAGVLGIFILFRKTKKPRFWRGFVFKRIKNPATSYSPTRRPEQYHRHRRA